MKGGHKHTLALLLCVCVCRCPECDDGGDLLSCDGPCMRAFHFGFR